MDSDHPGWQIALLLILIIANGVFSATELAIVSAKKPRLAQRASQGDSGAKAALEIAQDPNQLFSTIQIGITAIGIITGMVGASTLSDPLAAALTPALGQYAQAVSLFLIMAVVTFLTLLIGELVPKRIAINSPESVASWVARPMNLFARINLPLVWFLTFSTTATLKLLGIKIKAEQPVTEEEIRFLLRQGARLGTFDADEPELIDRVFRLNDIPAEYIMTARPQLEWLDLAESEEALGAQLLRSTHTRLPVGYESLDDFRGIVQLRDLLLLRLRRPEMRWHALIAHCVTTPLYIPETLTLNKTLDLFRAKNAHEAIILDEYGSPEGMVTLHDILEEILGAMPGSVAERIEERNRIVKRTPNSWLVDGLLPIEEFKEYFQITEALPKEGEDFYKTLGGFVIYLFGYLPKETEIISYRNMQFEVMDNDNYRVDKILVTKKAQGPDGEIKEA
ncbi:MAG: hemolysin family protein [Negativicoccus succinicivorans]|uniref:hemolysin family protein n=1 Tax=Negativicoccus succinicivorans TaxID=620903 RepID=UPI002907CF76|nr:hemolysin family protein [Negativicoccus succinicivorans]MDU5395462.1 hemolysin family protein [Negativicoccus succinicivorans]